eukprot:Filipodium_phascolosomae@DN8086_c0_g1_i1.p1
MMKMRAGRRSTACNYVLAVALVALVVVVLKIGIASAITLRLKGHLQHEDIPKIPTPQNSDNNPLTLVIDRCNALIRRSTSVADTVKPLRMSDTITEGHDLHRDFFNNIYTNSKKRIDILKDGCNGDYGVVSAALETSLFEFKIFEYNQLKLVGLEDAWAGLVPEARQLLQTRLENEQKAINNLQQALNRL